MSGLRATSIPSLFLLSAENLAKTEEGRNALERTMKHCTITNVRDSQDLSSQLQSLKTVRIGQGIWKEIKLPEISEGFLSLPESEKQEVVTSIGKVELVGPVLSLAGWSRDQVFLNSDLNEKIYCPTNKTKCKWPEDSLIEEVKFIDDLSEAPMEVVGVYKKREAMLVKCKRDEDFKEKKVLMQSDPSRNWICLFNAITDEVMFCPVGSCEVKYRTGESRKGRWRLINDGENILMGEDGEKDCLIRDGMLRQGTWGKREEEIWDLTGEGSITFKSGQVETASGEKEKMEDGV